MSKHIHGRAPGLLLVAVLAACVKIPAAPSTDPAPPVQKPWPTGVTPPQAARKPHVVSAPAGDRNDPYYWLRDDTRENPEMLAYLESENAYVKAMTAPLHGLEDRVNEEMRSHIQEEDRSAPVFDNGWWYYTRYERGKEHAIHARRKARLDAPEQVLLDGNVLAVGHAYFEFAALTVSPDNRWLAYAEDTVGRREFVVRIKNLVTGEVLADSIAPVQGDLAWLNDNATVLYTEIDPVTLLGYRVRAHRVGEPMKADPIVYVENDNTFGIGVGRSKSGRYVFVYCGSADSSEQHFADATALPLAFRPILPREPRHEYSAEHLGEDFIIRSNSDAPNFRILRAPVASSADRGTWVEVMAHRADAFVEGFDIFNTHLAVNERSGGLRKVRILPWAKGSKASLIDATEPAYTATLLETPELDSPSLRYVYQSMTTPDTVIDYELASGARTVRKVETVLGGFDAAAYVTEYVHAKARDGTLVPVSLVYRKSTARDGSAPLYLYAYGSYGESSDPAFDSDRLALLDRGFVYAIVHVRGGQELGRAWYEGGRLLNKRNTFTDFIDATDFLVAGGYGARDQVFAEGRSAGGLLMGAISNMAPEKYRGIVAGVPFVDVVTTMLDESIPLTTGEFDEWGNPRDKRSYDYMLTYSPYDNVKPHDYPAMYVTSGLWDSQVQYYEPAKWVARLRAADTTPQTPILFRVNMQAGHGGKSGRFERLRERAQTYAFALALAGRRE
ncbi:MAG: S9 family peptidase [Panacagrimonas sp.]